MKHRKSGAVLTLLLVLPAFAQASMFAGETLDTVANVMAWVKLIVAPGSPHFFRQ